MDKVLFGSVGVILACLFFMGGSYYYFLAEPELTAVSIGMNMWPGYSHHTLVGIEKGFFEDEGINLQANIFNDYMDAQEAFRDGIVDGFFGVYNDALLLAAEGYPVRIVYVADFSNGGDTVVSSPDISEVDDLKGKTVGIAQFDGFSHLFLLDLLRTNGVSEDDVTFVEVSEYDTLSMLDSGYIDAGHMIEPFHSMAMEKGYNFLASSEDVPGSIVDVLVIRADLVEENPEVVQGVVDGLLRSERYVIDNSEEVLSYVSSKTGVGSGELRSLSAGIKVLNREDNKFIFDRDAEGSLYDKGEFIVNFYLDRGLIDERVDLDEVLKPRFVFD